MEVNSSRRFTIIRTISVGLIGCGRIAEIAHMPGYQVVKRAQLVAVADKNLQRAEWLAKRFGVKNFYANPQEIIERNDIYAVDIFQGLDLYRHGN